MLPEKLPSLKDKIKEVELNKEIENNNAEEQKKESEEDEKILDKEECVCGKMHKTGSKVLESHKNKGRSK